MCRNCTGRGGSRQGNPAPVTLFRQNADFSGNGEEKTVPGANVAKERRLPINRRNGVPLAASKQETEPLKRWRGTLPGTAMLDRLLLPFL
jgi:hypothetical protein